MFNFTTQTVYNKIDRATSAQVKNGTKANVIVATGSKKPYVRIGNTRFDASLIEKIYVKAPTIEYCPEVTFDMSSITFATGETEAICRIVLYIGLSMNSLDSVYANPFVYKGKPLYVEFKAFAGNAAKTARECKKVADKFMLFETDEKLLNVEVVDSTKVKISGVNGYQLIKKAVLQKFNPEKHVLMCCEAQGDFEDIITGVPVVWYINTKVTGLTLPSAAGRPLTVLMSEVEEGETPKAQKITGEFDGNGKPETEDIGATEVAILPGLEAFGSYDWIIHNLRLPTYENMNYWTSNKEEMPLAGQFYTLFTIIMKDTRDRVAGESVGMRTTSVTTHVLYVKGHYMDSNSEAKKVYDVFTDSNYMNLSNTIVKIGKESADPYNTGKNN